MVGYGCSLFWFFCSFLSGFQVRPQGKSAVRKCPFCENLRYNIEDNYEELKKNDPRIQRDPLLLATREYNKMAYDKTLWYTICYDEVRRIEETLSQNETPLSQNETPLSQNETPLSQNETPLSQNETPLFHSASMDSSNLIEPITETTHETTQETTAAAAETQREKSSTNNGDFAQALRAYQDSFGPLGSSFKYEKFQMLWDEHPVSEIHEYARKEMCRAMMDDSRRVHPNLAYYAQCLATGAARAEGKRSERRGDGKRRNVPKRTVVDFDDPAVKAWMAERSKNGRHD